MSYELASLHRVLTAAALFVASVLADFRAAAAGCVPVPAGVVGWWPGEGDAKDIVSTNNGVLQGTASANAVGLAGSGFNFDGTNGYVQIADSPLFHPTNLTIEA